MSEEQQKPQQHNTNCPKCNKLISKLKRYYRNGTYYCTKQCWKAFLQQKKES